MISIPFVIQTPVGAPIEMAFGQDVVQMVIHAGPMAKFVLWILLIFSIISWAIVFVKFSLVHKAKKQTATFLDLFRENRELKKIYSMCEELKFSPVACLFSTGYTELSRIRKIQASSDDDQDISGPDVSDSRKAGGVRFQRSQQTIMDNLERSLNRANLDQVNKLEKALGFLASTGNTAPFIGLFGTVWGLMGAFSGIGLKGSASLSVVAPGISEALITTAAGLVVAIPAVIAYNYFTNRTLSIKAEMDIFTSDFLSMVERQLFSQIETAAKTEPREQ